MSDEILELSVAWQRHVNPSTELFERVMARHREKHRRYHTARHVAWVVRHVDALVGALADDDRHVADHGAVVAAVMYHDAVYEPASPANERASARLARRDLGALGWSDDRIEHVTSMIEGTAHHRDPPDLDTAVLYDADLAILGTGPGAYADYSTQVRTEYRHVGDDDWSTGRREVLRSLLARPSIYTIDVAIDRWEERARGNLATELARLGER